MTQDHPEIDLTSCDREPIHLLGHVQSFGCLIAVSGDWLVMHASENVSDILGLTAASLIGSQFEAHFPVATSHQLRGQTQTFHSGRQYCRLFGIPLFDDERMFDISIHQTDRGFIYEFEQKTEPKERDDHELVQTLVANLSSQPDMESFLSMGAIGMRHLSGFDRVMVYRFNADETGVVVGEAVGAGFDRFMGLRYPASDIPKQARALYLRNKLRLIADTDAPTSPIVPAKCPRGDVIDLSFSATRAVSPTHLQYLRNMDTRASMSASIIREGKLWGLFACHHMTPRYVDFERRSAIELFTQLFTYELSERLNAEAAEMLRCSKALHDRIMVRVSSGHGLLDDFASLADEIEELIDFDGIAVFCDDTYISLGVAPTETEFIRLVRFLNTTTMGAVYATDQLSSVYDHAEELADRIAGLLVLPISRSPRDYIVLFRSEIRRTVTWAGRPDKPVGPVTGTGRLHPRTSFEAWQEEVIGRCDPWSEATLSIANTLRYTLLEIVLKITDEGSRAARHHQQKQELMVAELNHRVRNILNLISGIVSQGQKSNVSIASYVADLDGRIQALARAHDQLTQKDWETASLKTMLQTEIAAYAGNGTSALRIEGPDVELVPGAFSTLALVTHELVTNAVKYGALASDSGCISVSLVVSRTGALQIYWRELGGPPVQAPTREGFGSTIIQRSVPFDLQGRAEMHFTMTGLVAEFEVPSSNFILAPLDSPEVMSPVIADFPSPAGTEPADGLEQRILSGQALIVEDNMVIAMDAIAKLSKLGANQVHTASTVAAGLKIIDSETLECAILDVNLGRETSLIVANRLFVAGIPFVVATGYGSDGTILSNYPAVEVLKKPYDLSALRRALEIEIGRRVDSSGAVGTVSPRAIP